jgi:hypothetical protein
MLDMFETIDFETISTCNRSCPTCMRNSYPDRKVVESFFKPTYLPIETIKSALDQCVELGFTGSVILNHYNEPLMDDRLVDIIKMVRAYPQWKSVWFHSNGDYLTENLAAELDGTLDRIVFTLYMPEPMKSERARWIRSLFPNTYLDINTYSEHIVTHFSPRPELQEMIDRHKYNPCTEVDRRIAINHRGDYLLCCDDMVGHFDLGSFPEISIKDYWFGKKHTDIAMNLHFPGGRLNYPHCSSCPRS